MTIQRTLWSRDTCDPTGENKFSCQIEYEWDDTVPQDQRTHTVSQIIKTCPIHQHHIDKVAHYQDVLDENQSKNKAIGLLIKTFVKLDGGQDEIKWRFEEDRTIVLSHPLLTQKDKDDANALDKSDIKKSVRIE